MGPVSLRSSRATGFIGIRTATVPLVSPRSQDRLGVAVHTRVSGPGQNSSIRSRPWLPRSSTSAVAARMEPTRTGGGMSLPRPLVSRSLATAFGLKASVPMPYTVSVGSTTRSPRRTADAASAMPSLRAVSSAQS